jgi:hypothetical protein
MSTISSQVTVRLFVGVPITSEIRVHLQQSLEWKQSTLSSVEDMPHLVETHYQSKDYIGIFLPEEQLPLDELRKIEKTVRLLVQVYCPQTLPESLHIIVFPQVFIS